MRTEDLNKKVFVEGKRRKDLEWHVFDWKEWLPCVGLIARHINEQKINEKGVAVSWEDQGISLVGYHSNLRRLYEYYQMATVGTAIISMYYVLYK